MSVGALDFALWGAAVLGWSVAILDIRHALATLRLPKREELLRDGDALPSVTVVVPSRDEAARIAGTVERLLAQRFVELEVVVVDDRSQDATAAIVERIGARDARVRLVRVGELPVGWIGKCHAMQKGGETAIGDWILFTDGDAWIADDVVARAVAVAKRMHVDHVAIAPHQIGASLFGEAGLSAFAVDFARFMSRANRDVKDGHVGIGAFNLVRASAWRAIGGHTQLAYEVIDDLKLGLLLVRGGFRSRAFLSPDAVHVEWSRSLFGIVKALEKNLFAALRYDTRIVALLSVLVTAFYALAITGAVVGGLAGWLACTGLLARAIPAILLARKHGASTLAAILSPIAAPVMLVAALNSTRKAYQEGGVRWRGTTYPLGELRRRLVH